LAERSGHSRRELYALLHLPPAEAEANSEAEAEAP